MRRHLQINDAEADYTCQSRRSAQTSDGLPGHLPLHEGLDLNAMAEAVQHTLTALAEPPCTCMPCLELRFSTQTLPAEKFAELDRQLAGQQAGLNALTVAEYLEARARYTACLRRGSVARRARSARQTALLAERLQALLREGMAEEDALAVAKADVARQMRDLHALHNPDLIAGGRDVIADFGDGEVNSTIGRQWNRPRGEDATPVQDLDAAARQVPAAARLHVHMNGRLQRTDRDGSTAARQAVENAATSPDGVRSG